jgi:hypothetical protein
VKKYKSLITPIIALAAVGLWLYVHRYPTARIPTTCEKFTAGVAIDFVRPEWCKRIRIEAVAGAGDSAKGFQIDSWRSDCFLAIAIETSNPKLCSEVKPIRSDWFGDGLADGSGYNEAYCIARVKKSRGYNDEGVGFFISNDELAPFMHQLGYTDQTLLDAGIDPSDTYSWDKYVHKLLWNSPGMPRYEQFQQEKRDFLRKVDHLRCREPFANVAWDVGITLVLIFVTFFAALRIWSIVR